MRRAAPLLALLAALGACAPDTHKLEHDARVEVFQKLSLPDQPVVVGPAVVSGDFAVVDWTRGGLSGGRTLLHRQRGQGGDQWKMILCGGSAVRRRPVVEHEGQVPDIVAGNLITKLLGEESRIDQMRREQLDRYEPLPANIACPEARG